MTLLDTVGNNYHFARDMLQAHSRPPASDASKVQGNDFQGQDDPTNWLVPLPFGGLRHDASWGKADDKQQAAPPPAGQTLKPVKQPPAAPAPAGQTTKPVEQLPPPAVAVRRAEPASVPAERVGVTATGSKAHNRNIPSESIKQRVQQRPTSKPPAVQKPQTSLATPRPAGPRTPKPSFQGIKNTVSSDRDDRGKGADRAPAPKEGLVAVPAGRLARPAVASQAHIDRITPPKTQQQRPSPKAAPVATSPKTRTPEQVAPQGRSVHTRDAPAPAPAAPATPGTPAAPIVPATPAACTRALSAHMLDQLLATAGPNDQCWLTRLESEGLLRGGGGGGSNCLAGLLADGCQWGGADLVD